MNPEIHIIYPVTELDRSRATFQKLFGVEPYVESPYYVGSGLETRKSSWIPRAMRPGFTDKGRAAMQERVLELKESVCSKDKADVEGSVLAKVAEMQEPDRSMSLPAAEEARISAFLKIDVS